MGNHRQTLMSKNLNLAIKIIMMLMKVHVTPHRTVSNKLLAHDQKATMLIQMLHQRTQRLSREPLVGMRFVQPMFLSLSKMKCHTAAVAQDGLFLWDIFARVWRVTACNK